MRTLTIDVESTTKNKGNPFNPSNLLCAISWRCDGSSYCQPPTEATLSCVQEQIDRADLIIGFNFKFDYHWLRRVGLNLKGKQIWDVQIAEYVLRYQRESYLSLEDVCESYGIEGKLDVVSQYWDAGIDTTEIPWDVLRDYAKQDVKATEDCFNVQYARATPAQRRLIQYMGLDLAILEEMEWNGLKYNEQLCKERAQECEAKIAEIHKLLMAVYSDVPINFGSTQQLSAFLYGGTITQVVKEHDGFFKTGKKAGEPKYRNVVLEHVLPRLVEPLPKSEMAKEGIYSTSEDTLLKLKGKAAKKFVSPLLELAKQEKLLQTYYKGIPAINEQYNWPHQTIHGTLNQTVTRTGRISATKPNQQNFAGDCQDIFVTRYD